MRHPATRIRLITAAALAVLAAAAAPAVAGPAVSGIDLWYGEGLPPRADTGKPAIVMPPVLLAPEPQTCVPGLPCGTRVLGDIRKDGAVVLQVPALRW
jgi:hypothetical protein